MRAIWESQIALLQMRLLANIIQLLKRSVLLTTLMVMFIFFCLVDFIVSFISYT